MPNNKSINRRPTRRSTTNVREADSGATAATAPPAAAPPALPPTAPDTDATRALWAALHAHPGHSISELAVAAGISRAAAQKTMDALEAAGLASCEQRSPKGSGRMIQVWSPKVAAGDPAAHQPEPAEDAGSEPVDTTRTDEPAQVTEDQEQASAAVTSTEPAPESATPEDAATAPVASAETADGQEESTSQAVQPEEQEPKGAEAAGLADEQPTDMDTSAEAYGDSGERTEAAGDVPGPGETAPTGALKDAEEADERRGICLSQTADGMWRLDGALDSEGGAILKAALEAMEGTTHPDDKRTAPQRHHDSMIELGRRRLGAGARADRRRAGRRTDRLGPGALRQMVLNHLRENADQDFGPVAMGTVLGRSSGAVANASEKLLAEGAIVQTSERPRRFRLAGPRS